MQIIKKFLPFIVIYLLILVSIEYLYAPPYTVPYRIRLADSSYTAQLRGHGGRTSGITITGYYSSTFKAHEFLVSYPGLYDLWFDPAGGTDYTKDAAWSSLYGKYIETSYFMDIVDADYDYKIGVVDTQAVGLPQITTALRQFIEASGGGYIYNLGDDSTLQNNPDSTIGIKLSYLFDKMNDSLNSIRTKLDVIDLNINVPGFGWYDIDEYINGFVSDTADVLRAEIPVAIKDTIDNLRYIVPIWSNFNIADSSASDVAGSVFGGNQWATSTTLGSWQTKLEIYQRFDESKIREIRFWYTAQIVNGGGDGQIRIQVGAARADTATIPNAQGSWHASTQLLDYTDSDQGTMPTSTTVYIQIEMNVTALATRMEVRPYVLEIVVEPYRSGGTQ